MTKQEQAAVAGDRGKWQTAQTGSFWFLVFSCFLSRRPAPASCSCSCSCILRPALAP